MPQNINTINNVNRFRDDESNGIVKAEDVKKTFSLSFNVQSKKDFDLWFANHFEQVCSYSAYTMVAMDVVDWYASGMHIHSFTVGIGE